ncbi:MAG: hypothetical protein HFH41_06700 [Lachnospiraceae bacterium]|nr:hypothetical protein [Lachnospiraceae bacterium]
MQRKRMNSMIMIQSLMIIAALSVGFLCITKGADEYLWLLPCLYTLCFLLFMVGKWYFTKMSVLIINGCCFIRYVCLPFAYYYMNEGGLSVISDRLFYNGPVIFIMFWEMFAIFFIIFLSAHRVYEREQEIRQIKLSDKMTGGSAFFILMAGIILVVWNPNLLHLGRMFHGITAESSALVSFIYNSASVILALWVILFLKKTKYIRSDSLKCVSSFLIWCVFSLDCSIDAFGNIGRWGLVIRLCVGLFIFQGLYREQFRSLVILAGVFVVISVFYLTLAKFEHTMGDLDTLSSLKLIFSYKSLNAYCDGPTNIAYAVKMKAESGNQYSVLTLVNDIFGNFPVINHFFSAENRSPIYFNLAIYESGIARDQICPLSGQAYGALYYPGVFLLNGIITYAAMRMDAASEKEQEILKKYILKYLAVVWGLSTFLNLNIIFQMLWIDMLPLVLIQCFNYEIVWKKHFYKNGPNTVRGEL